MCIIKDDIQYDLQDLKLSYQAFKDSYYATVNINVHPLKGYSYLMIGNFMKV